MADMDGVCFVGVWFGYSIEYYVLIRQSSMLEDASGRACFRVKRPEELRHKIQSSTFLSPFTCASPPTVLHLHPSSQHLCTGYTYRYRQANTSQRAEYPVHLKGNLTAMMACPDDNDSSTDVSDSSTDVSDQPDGPDPIGIKSCRTT